MEACDAALRRWDSEEWNVLRPMVTKPPLEAVVEFEERGECVAPDNRQTLEFSRMRAMMSSSRESGRGGRWGAGPRGGLKEKTVLDRNVAVPEGVRALDPKLLLLVRLVLLMLFMLLVLKRREVLLRRELPVLGPLEICVEVLWMRKRDAFKISYV